MNKLNKYFFLFELKKRENKRIFFSYKIDK